MNAMVGRVSQRYVYVPLNVVNDKNQPVVRETSRMYNRMIRATGQVSQRVCKHASTTRMRARVKRARACVAVHKSHARTRTRWPTHARERDGILGTGFQHSYTCMRRAQTHACMSDSLNVLTRTLSVTLSALLYAARERQAHHGPR
jgi:hypothetical protein